LIIFLTLNGNLNNQPTYFLGIRDAVLAGNIDNAITLTNSLYPGVLQSNDDILFQLRCRKFIEMIGACAGTQITLSDHEDASIKFTAIVSQSDCESGDEIDGPLTPPKKRRVPKRRKVALGLHGLDDAMTAVLKFGCELQDDYRNDDREEIRNALKAHAVAIAIVIKVAPLNIDGTA
ncbi:2481_t:CDS:2, partial [Racocetra fulgida]